MAAPPHDRSRRLAVVGLGVVSMFFAATRMFGGGGEDPFVSLGQEPIAQPALQAATTGTTAPVTVQSPTTTRRRRQQRSGSRSAR